MTKPICSAFLGLLAILNPAKAGEAHAPPLPGIFDSLEGCWQGNGNVSGKPVGIALHIEPMLLGAMFAVDVDSSAIAKSSDRYQAHLLFGSKGSDKNALWGFWSDSFGADFTANGDGRASVDGFEVAYHYPDVAYVNRWRVRNGHLNWSIVSKSADAKEKPFAAYELRRTKCSGNAAAP